MSESPLLSRLRQTIPAISVGILTADLMSPATESSLLEKAGVPLVHVLLK